LQKFNEAAVSVKNLTKRPSDNDLLELYALYKQATVGDNNTGTVKLFLGLTKSHTTNTYPLLN